MLHRKQAPGMLSRQWSSWREVPLRYCDFDHGNNPLSPDPSTLISPRRYNGRRVKRDTAHNEEMRLAIFPYGRMSLIVKDQANTYHHKSTRVPQERMLPRLRTLFAIPTKRVAEEEKCVWRREEPAERNRVLMAGVGLPGKEVLFIQRRWEMSDVAKKESICSNARLEDILRESKTWFLTAEYDRL